MDVIVDHYFVIAERIGRYLLRNQDLIVSSGPARKTLGRFIWLKREMAPYPTNGLLPRDVVGNAVARRIWRFKKTTLPYLRDLADHINQVIETMDSPAPLVSRADGRGYSLPQSHELRHENADDCIGHFHPAYSRGLRHEWKNMPENHALKTGISGQV